MNNAVSPLTDHRDDPRMATHSPARFEAPHAIFTQAGSALIEEISACGLRVRSELQLHPDEELILKVKGEPFPLHASVVWVQEGPVQAGGHKTWIAGCKFHPDSIAKARLAPEAQLDRKAFLGRKALLLLAVVAVGVALLVYSYLRFVTMIGGRGIP